MNDAPNINAHFGEIAIEELVRLGAGTFVVAPGSRSAPIVAAIARHPGARARVVVDERAAGFVALGTARASGSPAVVVTTSGSAVANLLPAVVEASMDGVPLILLTADRPPELLDAGANQAIDQPGIFGRYTRWAHALPCPDERLPARAVLTAIDHAVARALAPEPGPVHLNWSFREPLAPDAEPFDASRLDALGNWRASGAPFVRHLAPAPRIDPGSIEPIARRLSGRAGLVVAGAGPGQPSGAIVSLAEALAWPLVADLRSGLRLGNRSDVHVPGIERIADRALPVGEPEIVLQLGARITSRRILTLLEREGIERVLVDPSTARLDPVHGALLRVEASISAFAEALRPAVGTPGTRARERLARFAELDGRIRGAINRGLDTGDGTLELVAAREVARSTPASHALFVSSSLPIRELEAFAPKDGPHLRVAANRGASGIDGIVSSAVGFAAGLGRRVTLLVGDLAFLHDVGSLALVAAAKPPIVIVLLDNRGGGIFRFLPIARHEEIFSPWFDAPHEMNLSSVGEAFGLSTERVESAAAFTPAYHRALERRTSSLVHVVTEAAKTRAAHAAIDEAIVAVAVADRA